MNDPGQITGIQTWIEGNRTFLTTTEHVQFIYAGDSHGGSPLALRVVTESQESTTTTTKCNHFDHLGSVTAVSDENGQVVSAAWGWPDASVIGYDPWGAQRNPEGSAADPSSFGLLVGRRAFTGQETVPGAGLVNMNGRMYDPVLGRFLSPDPNLQFAGDLQSYNRYSYVENNPLRYTDPTGYFIDPDFDMAVNVVIVATAIGVCAYSEGTGCPLAFAAIAAVYNASSAIAAGAPTGQVIAIGEVSFAAGAVGGGFGGAVAEDLGGQMGAQMIGGAIAGAMTSAMTSTMLGQGIGLRNVLIGAAEGAIVAGATWSTNNSPNLSMADAAEARGESGEAVAMQNARDRLASPKEGDIPDIDPRVFKLCDSCFPGYGIPSYQLTSEASTTLAPIFSKYGTDLSAANFRFDPDLSVSHTVGDNITLGKDFIDQGRLSRIDTLVHDLGHVAQYQAPGTINMFFRSVGDWWKNSDVYAISSRLQAETLGSLNIVNGSYTLEAGATRLGAIAVGNPQLQVF